MKQKILELIVKWEEELEIKFQELTDENYHSEAFFINKVVQNHIEELREVIGETEGH